MERSVLIGAFLARTDAVWRACNRSQHNTSEPSCFAQTPTQLVSKADVGITSSHRRKNVNAQNESTIQISALCACQQQLVAPMGWERTTTLSTHRVSAFRTYDEEWRWRTKKNSMSFVLSLTKGMYFVLCGGA